MNSVIFPIEVYSDIEADHLLATYLQPFSRPWLKYLDSFTSECGLHGGP
jgi:hypothetical protein